MSYQYASPQENPELGASQVGYVGSYLAPTGSNTEFSPIRRRDSLSKEFKLKRSVSTPNVRPQGTNDPDSETLGPPNERRRNKLGYHRTSIACRCTYSAVNQPPTPTTGQRQGTRATTGIGFASPSTSPAIPTGPTLETQPNPPYHQLAAMPSIPSMNQQPMKVEEEETYSAESKVPPNMTSSRAFGYEYGTSSWVSTDPGSNVSKVAGGTNDPWASYPDGLSETSGLSSYASHAPIAPLSTGWSTSSPGLSRMDSNPRLDDAWRTYPSGTRSMSYSDDQSSQFEPLTRPFDRTQPAIPTNVAPGASMGTHGSLSAGAVPHPTYGSWRQPYQYSRSNEDYGGWYEDREHQAPGAHISSLGEDPSQAGESQYALASAAGLDFPSHKLAMYDSTVSVLEI
ncbi:hypothetical protein F5B19DRAFT_502106 [Rostrohypoxylon terebratum]|nr:hypothetical protein F5B19DRAFT_502106 [Rostrohypoxylon terebratum]